MRVVRLFFLSFLILSIKPVFGQKKSLNVVSLAIPCENLKDPIQSIKKAFTQQMDKHSPNTMDITNEYISWSKEHPKGGFGSYGLTTVTLVNTVYYTGIEDLEVISKKERFEIRFKNKSNDKLYIVFLKDKDLAIEGYSAIDCMIKSANEN